MTPEEIATLTMPEGIYEPAMRDLRASIRAGIETAKILGIPSTSTIEFKSRCAAFESLYKLAKGCTISAPIDTGMVKLTRDDISMEKYRVDRAHREGRESMLADVMRVVNEMYNVYDDETLDELKCRLSALAPAQEVNHE